MNSWNKQVQKHKRKHNHKNKFTLKPLSPKAKNYINDSNSFMNIAVGSIRSGKTISSILRFYKHIKNNPHTDFAMAGKTIGSLKRNVVKPFLRLLDSYNILYEYKKFENEIHIIPFEKVITLFGIDKSGSEDIIKGFTCAGSLIDEATVMHPEGVRMLISRNSLSGAKIFLTCNPANPNNFLYTEYVDNTELLQSQKCKVYNFLLEDNLTLTQEYIDNLKSMYPVDSVFYKRNILGQWISGHGLIYSQFQDKHIITGDIDLEQFDYIELGSDYGASSTTCFNLIGIKEYEDHNEYTIIDEDGYNAEKEGVSLTDDEIVEKIYNMQEQYNLDSSNVFYCSHDATSLKTALEKDHRIQMTIDSFKPDTLECISNISSLFYQDYIRIHNRCSNTIECLHGYEWDSKAAARGEDKPLKSDDHYADSIRAPIMAHLCEDENSYSELIYI